MTDPAGDRACEVCGGRGRQRLFRQEFSVEAQPRKATLRIAGLGDYDARVNGRRLAETGINQPWSQYEDTIYYRDFDITAIVRTGTNCVGVMLTNSFWNNPDPPQGWHRVIRRAASQPPRIAPCRSSASSA